MKLMNRLVRSEMTKSLAMWAIKSREVYGRGTFFPYKHQQKAPYAYIHWS